MHLWDGGNVLSDLLLLEAGKMTDDVKMIFLFFEALEHIFIIVIKYALNCRKNIGIFYPKENC